MQIHNYEEITLGSNTFQHVRASFDLLLQKLFKKMSDNDSEEGIIDLKVQIGIRKEWIPDEKSDGGSKMVNIPVIKHKIATQVPVKDSADGSNDTGMALVYDEDMMAYVLRHVSMDGQMSIYDMQDNKISDDDMNPPQPDQIEGKAYLLLEEHDSTDEEA